MEKKSQGKLHTAFETFVSTQIHKSEENELLILVHKHF